MRALKVLIASVLALTALVGLVLAFVWQPVAVLARTDDPPPAPLHPATPEQPEEWWEGWYFKDPFTDYAPSGVPDFDQRQDRWGVGNRRRVRVSRPCDGLQARLTPTNSA